MVFTQSRHHILAKSRLQEVEALAKYWGFSVHRDNWPFHIILVSRVQTDIRWSVACSGFTKRLDLQRLNKTGSPDGRSEERGFISAQALINFLNRKKSKEIKKVKSGN